MAILAMATLQASISRRIGDRVYLKYFIVIPSHLVESRGWKKGEEISINPVGKTSLGLRPSPQAQEDRPPTFDEFAQKVENVLTKTPEGMPWTRIRETTGLPQSKPSALWVKRMQEERGLVRLFNPKTSRFIWKLDSKKGLERWITSSKLTSTSPNP
jgi:hypothetical protein